MPSIEACMAFGHHVWLVAVAASVCVFGSWVLLGLFERALQAKAWQRWGWTLLAAITAGASIWCTHFVAMLAYDPGVPVGFDLQLTIASALIATLGAGLGLTTALIEGSRGWAAAGGALLGLSISMMHYSGMLAYRIEGLVTWRTPLLLASLVIACVFGALSLHVAAHGRARFKLPIATALLVASICGLHFTGMAALTVTPLTIDAVATNGEAATALALAIVGMTVLIVGTGLVSHLIDQEVRADSFKRLFEMAHYDGLTKLSNRTFFLENIVSLIAEATRAHASVALVAIDLNGLKEINDQYGHNSGDAILELFAERLRDALKPGEVCARLGGDEFAVAQISHGQRDVDDLADRLAAILRKPVTAGDLPGKIGARMGAAMFPQDAADVGALVNNALLAMYRAKAEHIADVCFYERSMDEKVRANRRMAADLNDAILNDQLEVHYQVQRSCETNAIVGFEALARWPRGDFTPPNEFIPVAEQYGLIDALGDWVLRKACAEAALWDPPYKVAVNLSPLQLTRPDLPEAVATVLRQTGLPPARLELELTESALIRDAKASMKILREIRELGVTLALDDFGTGHSSLSTLRAFPFDKIKLDRSFLREIETSAKAETVLEAVLGLGKGLGIAVLTEGVETPGQLDLLRAKGCAMAQGFLLGRPAPMESLEAEGVLRIKPLAGPALAAA